MLKHLGENIEKSINEIYVNTNKLCNEMKKTIQDMKVERKINKIKQNKTNKKQTERNL